MKTKLGAVTLAVMSDGYMHSAMVQCMWKLMLDPRFRGRLDFDTGGGFLEMESGPRIASARNQIVERFLDKCDAEWLWMLDTDHTFTPDVLERMLSFADPVQAPIVGALCMSGGAGGAVMPVMMRKHIVEGQVGFEKIIDWTPGEAVEVDATGAACLLVHRGVFEAMRDAYGEARPKATWFAEGMRDQAEFGEDVFFCLSARRLGFPIYVLTSVEAPHVKTWIIDSTDFYAFRSMVEAVGEPAVLARAVGKRNGQIIPLQPPVEEPPVALNRQQRRKLERAST